MVGLSQTEQQMVMVTRAPLVFAEAAVIASTYPSTCASSVPLAIFGFLFFASEAERALPRVHTAWREDPEPMSVEAVESTFETLASQFVPHVYKER